MDKTATLASGILLGIGGEQNILRLENCMTRVRVEVKDDAVLDIPRLKQLPGVSGYVKQGHSISSSSDRAKRQRSLMPCVRSWRRGDHPADDDIERTKSQVKAKYKAPMSDALRKLANVLFP